MRLGVIVTLRLHASSHHRSWVRVWTWLLVCVGAAGLLRASVELEGSPSASVQQALGISAKDAGGFEALSRTCLLPRKALTDQLLVDLAGKIVQGLEPESVTIAIGDEIRLGQLGVGENRRFGTVAARAEITWRMIELARSLKTSKPDVASRLVRAAMVIAVQDRVSSHRALYELATDSELRAIGALDDTAAAVFQEVYAEIRAGAKAYTSRIITMAPLLDGIIEAPKIDMQKAQAFVSSLSEVWETPEANLDCRLFGTKLLWRLRCLATARQDEECLKLVRATVKRLEAQSKHPLVRGWLDRVESEPGPAPRSSGVKIITDPNQTKPEPR